jgi:glutathione S-transferase
VRRLAAAQLYENYQIADDWLAGREYFFDQFTAADAHFFWCFRRGKQFELDLARFTNCQAHFARLEQRPSIQRCLAYEKTVLAEFTKAA